MTKRHVDWLLMVLALHGDLDMVEWLTERWPLPDDWLDRLEADPGGMEHYPGLLSTPTAEWACTLRYTLSVLRLIYTGCSVYEIELAVEEVSGRVRE